MIIFSNWQITAPRGVIARQYDNLSRRLEVVGELPEGYTWSILVQVGEDMDVITLESMEGGAGVTLTADWIIRPLLIFAAPQAQQARRALRARPAPRGPRGRRERKENPVLRVSPGPVFPR
ncbi:hypothetical protein [Pseudoflavonifractor phocaeensis]|uniref:hypothetical protein n=1 Tax=Pseudoflavonifractor phocaeensis TaxID=1870988 RepID=UPI002285EFBE|nr:hypothetical protein [Pseudoflavonifractor phocaeensis]